MNATYLVNVHTEAPNDGCFAKSFDSLDEARVWIKDRAASFRSMARNPGLKCFAFIVRNGLRIADGRTLAC